MNRHLHSPTKLTEFARDFEEEPETFFTKFVNKITNVYNTSYNTVNELPITSTSLSSSGHGHNTLTVSTSSNLNKNHNNENQSISRTNSSSSVNSSKQSIIGNIDGNGGDDNSGNGGRRGDMSGIAGQLKIYSSTNVITDKSTSDSLESNSEDTSESLEKVHNFFSDFITFLCCCCFFNVRKISFFFFYIFLCSMMICQLKIMKDVLW